MKTEKQIKILLKRKQAELKSYGKSAQIQSNAPLALIQCNIEGQIKALQFILK